MRIAELRKGHAFRGGLVSGERLQYPLRDEIAAKGLFRSQATKRLVEAVKKYLLCQGLSEESKVDTAGSRSDRPISPNKTN